MARALAALAMVMIGVIAACQASADATPASVPTPAPVPTPSMIAVGPAPTASARLDAVDVPTSPSPSPIPRPTPDPTPVPIPPKPTGVSFGERRTGDDPPTTEITQTVTWGAPVTEGVEIRVYGVTECVARPADPSPDTRGPCIVEHTPLPASVRTLLATAAASDGVVSWTWTGTFDCEIGGVAYDPRGPGYHAVVLAAYNASGHSIFAIAEPGAWWQPGVNDIVC
jgi:hypothetical protein